MRELDYSLARAGFEVYGVDLPGHGRSRLRLNSAALDPWFSDLLGDMTAKGLLAQNRVYLVGHSLGSLVVTRAATDHPDLGVGAVVALSPIYAGITPTEPANYLCLYGQSELPGVKDTALKALAAGTGLAKPALDKVYGDYASGTARAASMVAGASHVSIPGSGGAIAATVRWLRASAGLSAGELPRLQQEKAERAFGLAGAALLVLGLFYLVAGLVGLLGHAPRRPAFRVVVEEARVAAGLPARPRALAPGEAAPPLPDEVKRAHEKVTGFLTGARAIPILFAFAAVLATLAVGFLGTFGFLHQAGTDYLAAYLLAASALMAPLLAYVGKLLKIDPLVTPATRLGVPLSVALGLGLALATFLVVGWFASFSFSNIWPAPGRWGLIALLAVFFAPFAVVDELSRGAAHDRLGLAWGFMATVLDKLIMLVTWYLGLLLPHKPQALIVLGPLLIGGLIIIDLVNSLTYNEHGSWLAGAVYKALVTAWLAGTVFPLLAGPLSFN